MDVDPSILLVCLLAIGGLAIWLRGKYVKGKQAKDPLGFAEVELAKAKLALAKAEAERRRDRAAGILPGLQPIISANEEIERWQTEIDRLR